jgi:dUTP pyrophosphatase
MASSVTSKENTLLNVKRLHPDAKLPTVAYPGEDLGYDIYALEGINLIPGKQTKVRTGIVAYEEKIEGFELHQAAGMFGGLVSHYIGSRLKYGLLLRDRSSMAAKGITLSGGVIDAGYRGEISVLLTTSDVAQFIAAGDKIAQMIPIPVLTSEVVEVEELPESSRGEKGYGSSGR